MPRTSRRWNCVPARNTMLPSVSRTPIDFSSVEQTRRACARAFRAGRRAIFRRWRSSASLRRLSSFFDSASFFLRLKSFVEITTPFMPGGAFSDASFTSPAFSPKIAFSSFSSGVGSDSPFGVILPIRMSPSTTSAPMRTMPFSSRSFVASSLTFGISRVSSSSPRLVSRTWSSNSSIWIEVKTSCDTMRSLTMMASSKLYPCHGMNATSTFRPSASSPPSVAEPSASTSPFFTLSPGFTIALLVDAGILVRPEELRQLVFDAALVFERDERFGAVFVDIVDHDDAVGVDVFHDAVPFGHDEGTRIARDLLLEPGPDQRRLGAQQRHRLALHVRAHQRAVGVVVLEERDQAGRRADDLVRRNVHVLDLVRLHHREIALVARLDAVALEVAARVERRVRLRDRVHVFLFGGQELDLVRHPAVLHLPVRRLDEPELIHAGVDAERGDQPDVRTFRRLDRAEAAVVRVVHVAHFEAGAFARQTARPEGRHAALVRQLGQRIGLVHELRQRVRAEERVDDAADRARVHQVLRRQVLVVADVHPLADRARHAREADVELLRDLLADRPHAAVAEVIDVVHRALLLLQLDQVVDDRDDVLLRQRRGRHRDVEAAACR